MATQSHYNFSPAFWQILLEHSVLVQQLRRSYQDLEEYRKMPIGSYDIIYWQNYHQALNNRIITLTNALHTMMYNVKEPFLVEIHAKK